VKKVPLIIVADDGAIVDVAYANNKAAAKSIECGEIWYCHAETERVLPWRGGVVFEKYERRDSDSLGSWYMARVERALAEATGGATGGGTDATAGVSVRPAGRGQTGATSATVHQAAGDAEAALANAGEILAGLQATIKARREELPEGSYTTHLFSKGAEKIRKKTGEEAVELILARNAAELRSEAADLLYHLMVLLEVEDDSIGSVLAALRDRF